MNWLDTTKMRFSAAELLAALIVAVSLLMSGGAHAAPPDPEATDYINPDRPGIADGSNVVGAGRFQIETGIQQEYRHDDSDPSRKLFIPTLLRFGIDIGLELRVEGNTYTRMKAHGGMGGAVSSDGFAPTSIGFKYQFATSAGWEQPSVGAIFRVFPSSGSGSLRTSGTTGDLRLAADWDFASRWSLNPNIGVAVYEDDAQRSYTAGLLAATLNFNPSKILNFFIDAGIQSPETKHGRTSIIFDVGAAYLFGRNLQLDFSVGSGAAGLTSPSLFLSAGISKRF